ncbi:MAG: 2,3-diphosphoglycerate-dependent phosphoglycerate mutase, partial [Bacteroidales bacterium]
RHGESTWNKANRFTGWTDVDLTDKGVQEAREAGRLLKEQGLVFDMAYTSYLTRAIKTMNLVLEEMDLLWIPIEKNWRLNEKHYGVLQGLDKVETSQKYGEAQVKIWRRSYDIAPNSLAPEDPRSPYLDPKYKNIERSSLPLTESLKDTVDRIVPYWKTIILPTLHNQNEILIAAHGNSLRGIIKYIKNINNEELLALNIPTGVPYLLEFDDNMNLIKDTFLGDPEKIKASMDAVANQGKSK